MQQENTSVWNNGLSPEVYIFCYVSVIQNVWCQYILEKGIHSVRENVMRSFSIFEWWYIIIVKQRKHH